MPELIAQHCKLQSYSLGSSSNAQLLPTNGNGAHCLVRPPVHLNAKQAREAGVCWQVLSRWDEGATHGLPWAGGGR